MLLCGFLALHFRAADRGRPPAPGPPSAVLDKRVKRRSKARAESAARMRSCAVRHHACRTTVATRRTRTAKTTISMACERLADDGGSPISRAMPSRSPQGRAQQAQDIAKPAVARQRNFKIINNVESLAGAIALP